MLWEVEILPTGHDGETLRVNEEYRLLRREAAGAGAVTRSSRGFLLEGDIDREQVEQLVQELLLDTVAERAGVHELPAQPAEGHLATVLLKPGVMDPVAMSVVSAARDLNVNLTSVRTFRRYYGPPQPADARELLFRKVLANDAIEQIVAGPLQLEHLHIGDPYTFKLITVPLRDAADGELLRLSKEGQLALNLAEMKAIQRHFMALGRDPTDVELETFAQTWSEHCSHKTLKGSVDFYENPDRKGAGRRITNLLKETIFGATQSIRKQLGQDDWCVSVFEDNAGVVRFTDEYHVCFKVETHNHPSAIEPYGGANTGIGGVIRDPLGTALGAKPVCNTDVFCFARPDYPAEDLPPGVLHPLKVMKGVVSGVRDYGNRMGIPTVNGAVCFDDRYLGNPLVFCGTVGLIPVDRAHKAAQEGDLIVVVGGRTGRDGIHGATFSSIELTSESESISGGAVQIGNAITEKKLVDVLLQARDRNLYHAITDCGAGGFSSAIGEMGADLGAIVYLEKAPLKYEGLSYTEIWISEAQERMILAVPRDKVAELQALCASEDVESAVLGRFEKTGRLRLMYEGHQVADLDMHFLHEGIPGIVREAYSPPRVVQPKAPVEIKADPRTTLLRILSSLNVCSKHWIIRQYDHEIQGGSVIKPLVGVRDDGPSDAAVIAPVLGRWEGLAVGCGIQPHLGDLDPYAMAGCAIDEAIRNVVAVGADPARIAILDNFCWGNTDRPDVFGSLVRAAEACRDVALAYGTPFISGKDSLNNEFHAQGHHIVIPPTLLISALGRVADVRKCVSMDLKEPGNFVYLVGTTRDELGGSHFNLVNGLRSGEVPRVDVDLGPRVFRGLHQAIDRGLVRSCHDLSEGGLAVALAEMAFAGGLGLEVELPDSPPGMEAQLFSESCSRFLAEVRPGRAGEFEDCLKDVPHAKIGVSNSSSILQILNSRRQEVLSIPLGELKAAWQRPLDF
jgi:phosphoribosylformylglycinamidine synthase